MKLARLLTQHLLLSHRDEAGKTVDTTPTSCFTGMRLVRLLTQHFLFYRDEAGKTSDATLQAELSAVSALRQRLQEGVERNQQLHRSLLGHTGRHTDQLTSGECSHLPTH